MNLFEIAKKYPTSKNDHGFIEIYHKHFSNLTEDKINILEIGVERGDSLRMWREYFTNASICAIDLHDRNISVDNTEILIGDQSDHSFLQSVVNKYGTFDIIIDDGSHQSKHIITSFNFLFNHLSDNGIYVIEDLQTSYQPRYGGSRFNLIKKKSSMNFIKSLADSINYEHKDKPFFKRNTFDGSIKSISFYQNIAFITKGESVNYFFDNIKKSTFSDKIKKVISFFYR
jgi:8-demethyl-8-alpha-L-rhamnosyltetracenomycin-C 2'-O-methyltransferase